MSARGEFLKRIRTAVAAGNQAGQLRDLPRGPRLGYQGGGADLLQSFADGLRAAGGRLHVVSDGQQAVDQVVRLVSEASARLVAIESAGVLARVQVGASLRLRGIESLEAAELPAESRKERLFAADIGITGVDWLIAETGSIVLATGPTRSRSASLLPPVHIAVAERSQLIPDLFDLFDGTTLQARPLDVDYRPPTCLTIITGPSKTGDIELRLVTGVHGPGEVHVVLIDS